jgi:hypothetical protein
VKAAYVPPSQRIRFERSSKCGVCELLFGGAKLYGYESFVW